MRTLLPQSRVGTTGSLAYYSYDGFYATWHLYRLARRLARGAQQEQIDPHYDSLTQFLLTLVEYGTETCVVCFAFRLGVMADQIADECRG